jgi:hypothetical protein
LALFDHCDCEKKIVINIAMTQFQSPIADIEIVIFCKSRPVNLTVCANKNASAVSG